MYDIYIYMIYNVHLSLDFSLGRAITFPRPRILARCAPELGEEVAYGAVAQRFVSGSMAKL